MTSTPPEDESLIYDPINDSESFEPKPLPTGAPQEDFDDVEES